jgi:hypothetical protein
MRFTSLPGTCVIGFATLGLVFSACGSEDDKKKSNNDNQYTSGGEGGSSAGDGPSSKAGGSNDAAGEGNVQGGASGAGTGGVGPSGAGPGGAGPTAGAPSDAGAGGEGMVLPFHGLYIGEEGDDAAAGTPDAPFETLAHAASVAQAGDTIVFLDGAYTLTTTISIPAGVDLKAENAGAATIIGSGFNARIRLGGDTRLTGLELSTFYTAIDFADAATASGKLIIEQTKFTNCQQICLMLTGSVQAEVTGGAGVVISNGGQRFATLAQTASLSIAGGVLQNHGTAGIIDADDESSVTLTDLEVLDGSGLVLSLADESVGNVSGLTVATLGQALFEQPNGSTSTLTVTDSDLSMKPNAPANHCFLVYSPSKLSISGSKLHGCNNGLKGGIPAELTLSDTEFYDLEFGGADLEQVGPNAGGIVRVDGCQFHDVGYAAMRMGGSASLLDLKIRDTVIDVTTLSNWGGLIIAAGSASTLDLGTLAEPGGNTFVQRNAVQNTALRLNMQAITVQAVGNTWTPSLQGADAQGRYQVLTGKVREDATAVNSGINYIKPNATTTLRLAEIP